MKLLRQKPDHTNAIFQLKITVIAFFLRHLISRQKIPFIRSMDKVCTILLIQLLLPFLNAGNNFSGVLPVKRFQRIKALSVVRKAYRYHRNALNVRDKAGQVTNTSLQFFTIVDVLAENDLTIHDNTALIKFLKLLHDLARKTVVQHHTPQFRIGCMH